MVSKLVNLLEGSGSFPPFLHGLSHAPWLFEGFMSLIARQVSFWKFNTIIYYLFMEYNTRPIWEHMGNDGKQAYNTRYYNLNVILSVGY